MQFSIFAASAGHPSRYQSFLPKQRRYHVLSDLRRLSVPAPYSGLRSLHCGVLLYCGRIRVLRPADGTHAHPRDETHPRHQADAQGKHPRDHHPCLDFMFAHVIAILMQ